MKELFQGINKWIWADLLIFLMIFHSDITSGGHGSLWVTVVMVSVIMIFIDLNCHKYDYTLPASHELQPVNMPSIKANVVRAIAGIVLVMPAILLGSFLVKVAGILALVFSLVTFKDCWNLYLYVKSQG